MDPTPIVARDPNRRGRVADLYRDGVSTREIAVRLGVARATVNRDLRFLRQAGVAFKARAPVVSSQRTTRLARARVAAGLTQRMLAAIARVSVAAVADTEAGGDPHPDTAGRLAASLGLTAGDLWPQRTLRVAAEPPVDPAPEHNGEDEGEAATPHRKRSSARQKRIAARRRDVAAYYAAGLGDREIARRTGASRATIYRDLDALRAQGWTLPARPTGRPPR